MHPAARPFYLLWDHAHIWALLLSHALTDMGVPFRPVRGARIAAGLLRDEPPAALLVPGGFSRKKMESLGSAGVRAVREYMAGGGNYLGFCGGAGFAVTDAYGLGLCPWVRRGFANRLRHFASGHIRVQTKQSPWFRKGSPARRRFRSGGRPVSRLRVRKRTAWRRSPSTARPVRIS